MNELNAADLEEIRRHGLDEKTVRRQLEMCHDPPTSLELVRPATVGDGIVVLGEDRQPELLAFHEKAAAAGRFTKLVPASGAASRMFKAILAVHGGTAFDDETGHASRFYEERESLPFRDDLDAALQERGTSLAAAGRETFLEALLEDVAMAKRARGLVPFHRYGEHVRTPFEEHLFEATTHVRDGGGVCRVQISILRDQEEEYRSFWKAERPRIETELGTRFEVSFSFQEPSTDTVAADPDGGPFRDDGHLVFRPGGHGALIRNLGRLTALPPDGHGADLLYVKNIDNVVPDPRRGPTVLWKKLLGGYLCKLERRLLAVEERAAAGGDAWLDDARAFLTEDLGMATERLPTAPSEMRELLSRPLRVCGMVPATGETGGGPFWVRNAHGEESLQIVETSQVDRSRDDQNALLRQSTHFNPVDLACRLRDSAGNPFDLERYVDPDAVIVAKKSYEGRSLLGLELPGLWNGAMSGWLTIFVEVPATTFAPVKSVIDLLRPEHQND